MNNCLYKRLRQEVSYDGGYSWQPTGVYQTGDLIESDSPYCGYHDEYVFVIPNIGRDVSTVADEDGQTITYAITSTKNGEAIDYSISAPTWATVSKSATGVTIQVAPNSAEYDRNGSIVLTQNESNVRINISVSQAGGGTAFVFEFFGGGTTTSTEIPTSGGTYGYMVTSTKNGELQSFTIESRPAWCEEVRIAGQSIRVVASANTGDEKSGAIVAKQNESNKTITINLTQDEFVIPDYLSFEAVDDGFSFYFTSDVEYSLDNGATWNYLFANNTSPAFSSGTTICLKATLTPTSDGIGTFHNFGAKRFTVQGNPMSLLYGDNFTGQTSLAGKDNAFYELFNGCDGLTSAENMSLPATTLANYCYYNMFQGCTSLRTAPSVLPATTLANYCYGNMFNGCTSLTTAPVLSATTLVSSCYSGMFYGCTSLTTAPSLPGTTLADYCYDGMFRGCSSLTTAPSLPATTLADICYRDMFRGCTSLTTAPALPATTLADNCYRDMFMGCSSLTTAPELPATTLADECYYYMFKGCTSLTAAPVLSATTLAEYCYGHMFNGCTSLTTAPELPATTLASSCYNGMFYGCTRLTTAPVLSATTLANGCYDHMFYGCTSLTTAPSLPATTLADRCYASMFMGCTSLTTAPALPASALTNACYAYMFNGCTSLTTAPSLPGTTLANECYSNMFNGCTSLTTAPSLSAATLANSCYREMFIGCTSLTAAPSLPATSLTDNCYDSMFSGCTSLTTAQTTLPATTLAYSCYYSMFRNCTSLTTAPELPATTLVSRCYRNMFQGCSNLNSITCLATDISASECLNNWVRGVAASGTFTKHPSMTGWPTGNNGIPSGWAVKTSQDDKYLTFIAEEAGTFRLSGHSCLYSTDNGATWTTLASNTDSPTVPAGGKIMWKGNGVQFGTSNGCGIFSSSGRFKAEGNVMSLAWNDNFVGKTDFSSKTNIFDSLFKQCADLTDVSNLLLPATGLTNYCYQYMFQGCTSLTTVPVLPAATLKTYCYRQMFSGCTNLNSITCLATSISASNSTSNWVSGVAASGTFTKASSMSGWTTGVNGIPSGWTVQNAT